MVPDRFFAHAAALLDGLEAVAAPLGVVDPAAEFEDTLPNRASRWLYRLRAVDAMGRPSAAGQVLAVVVHVPSGARAVVPTLLSLAVAGGAATVRVDCSRAGGDVFVFVSSDTSLGTATASLSTIRNRDDLAPMDRLVVRDAAGRRLAPVAAVPEAAGDRGIAQVTAPIPPDGSRRPRVGPRGDAGRRAVATGGTSSRRRDCRSGCDVVLTSPLTSLAGWSWAHDVVTDLPDRLRLAFPPSAVAAPRAPGVASKPVSDQLAVRRNRSGAAGCSPRSRDSGRWRHSQERRDRRALGLGPRGGRPGARVAARPAPAGQPGDRHAVP